METPKKNKTQKRLPITGLTSYVEKIITRILERLEKKAEDIDGECISFTIGNAPRM